MADLVFTQVTQTIQVENQRDKNAKHLENISDYRKIHK